MNYEITPNWDTDLAIVFTVGNIPGNTLDTLVYDAVKMTTGAPTAVAGKYIPGATVRNAGSGVVYRNSGSTASPAWTAM
jgi:hypothetical protein